MKTRRFFLLVAILLLPLHLQAQPYEHAAGIRAGYSSGLTYKGFFLHRMSGVELDVTYNQHGLNISGLYVIHAEPFRKSRWQIYFGGGGFGGLWDDEPSLGLVAMGGIEYILRDLPLNFGFDWKPMLNIYKTFHYDLLDFGLTIRYRFNL
jgi:hypothetical protein